MPLKQLFQDRPFPFFLILLPLFFVLHGYVENYNLVSFPEVLLLFSQYLLLTIVLFFVSFLLLGQPAKASLLSFFLLFIFFFFGSLQDLMFTIAPETIITRYVFLLPVLLLLAVALAVLLRKRSVRTQNLFRFLNLLLPVLIFFEFFTLNKNQSYINTPVPRTSVTPCDTCGKPDIYLLVADGYGGARQLRDLFGYDNGPFLQQLQERGFKVIENSHSNYQLTEYSMASMLNMEYLDVDTTTDALDAAKCFRFIETSQVCEILQNMGYTIGNFSIFSLEGHPAIVKDIYDIRNARLISAQTMYGRFQKHVGHIFFTSLRQKKEKDQLHDNRKINETLANALSKAINKPSDQPLFVYTHLNIPHPPYYFDSAGKLNPDNKLTWQNKTSKSLYIDYLKWSNKHYLGLIDSILTHAQKPPVIIFVSDHGARDFEKPVPREYYFMNLSAVYFPSGKYEGLSKGRSNVNLFRVLLNNEFNQSLPLLKDSTIYIR